MIPAIFHRHESLPAVAWNINSSYVYGWFDWKVVVSLAFNCRELLLHPEVKVSRDFWTFHWTRCATRETFSWPSFMHHTSVDSVYIGIQSVNKFSILYFFDGLHNSLRYFFYTNKYKIERTNSISSNMWINIWWSATALAVDDVVDGESKLTTPPCLTITLLSLYGNRLRFFLFAYLQLVTYYYDYVRQPCVRLYQFSSLVVLLTVQTVFWYSSLTTIILITISERLCSIKSKYSLHQRPIRLANYNWIFVADGRPWSIALAAATQS